MTSLRQFATENLDSRLRAGLVGCWLGGGSGLTWFDRSGCGNHGALTNGPEWAMGGGGISGVRFDGSDDYVSAGSSLSLSPTAITVTARIKPESFPNGYNTIIGRENSAITAYYFFAVKSTGKLAVYLTCSAGPANYDGTGATTLSAGNKYAVAFCYDSVVGLRSYVNGVPDATIGPAGTLTSIADGTFIGAHRPATYTGGSKRNFSGNIGDVRIYNRALSAAEIALLARPDYSPIIQPSMGFRR